MQKFIATEDLPSGVHLIYEDSKNSSAPFFCPVCGFIMGKPEDFNYYYRYKCCTDCGMKFAQPNIEEWDKGARPSKEQIKAYIREIELKTRDIFLSDSDT